MTGVQTCALPIWVLRAATGIRTSTSLLRLLRAATMAYAPLAGAANSEHTDDNLAGDAIMKPITAILMASVLAVLGGCMVVPVSPGYYAGPPVYAAPPAAYYSPPAYYGPSIGVGIYGGGRGYRYR